MPGYRNNFLAH